ncbi:ankyrin repeat-containing protein [Rhizina undulata]
MPTLDTDTADDLLYLARLGETSELLETITTLTSTLNFHSAADLLLAANDEFTGNNVLHMAAGNGHLDTTKRILSLLPTPPTLRTEPHELVGKKNGAGNTPLHWAALNGHLEIVKLLIMEANADPTAVNNVGHDAVYEAELNEKGNVVEWVLGNCEALEDGIAEGKEEAGEGKEETGKGGAFNGANGVAKGIEKMGMNDK